MRKQNLEEEDMWSYIIFNRVILIFSKTQDLKYIVGCVYIYICQNIL